MKRTFEIARKTIMELALVALILFPCFAARTLAATPKRAPSNTLHFRNDEKRVDITVEIHGEIDEYTTESIEEIIEGWLEAAHFAVVNADGVDILELHIKIDVDDDDEGWHISTGCGDWDEDRDVDTLDALNNILHEMINDFIEHFVK